MVIIGSNHLHVLLLDRRCGLLCTARDAVILNILTLGLLYLILFANLHFAIQ